MENSVGKPEIIWRPQCVGVIVKVGTSGTRVTAGYKRTYVQTAVNFRMQHTTMSAHCIV